MTWIFFHINSSKACIKVLNSYNSMNDDFKASATNADTSHTCSRGHNNDYVTADYMDWS